MILLLLFVQRNSYFNDIAFGIFRNTLTLLDHATNIYVIYMWISLTGDDLWAVFQMLILVFEAIVILIDWSTTVRRTRKSHFLDPIFILLGLERVWFQTRAYTTPNIMSVCERYKLFELLLQSFPTVTLQTYILFLTKYCVVFCSHFL